MNDFQQRSIEVAECFLQTAVVVDDQARINDPLRPTGPLTTPGRRTLARSAKETEREEKNERHTLDAQPLVDSFAERGLICGVIAARPDTASPEVVARAARRADIVILDWQLDDHGERALSILREILRIDAGDRLRLIAIYTGEQDISGIGRKIAQQLAAQGWEFKPCDRQIELSLAHSRIVIYAKSKTSLTADLKDRSILEQDVPARLISDFAAMTAGLLPGVALTSLAAIRDNAHRILDRFDASLDAAFLTHRACLPFPADSQRHVVTQIAGELHALMDDAVANASPTGMEAIKAWIKVSAGQDKKYSFKGGKTLSADQAITLMATGLEGLPGNFGKNTAHTILTAGFAGSNASGNELDLQLAWMVNFRTVFSAPAPILHLGTIVRKIEEANPSAFFVCMRPRCDCVRLKKKEQFLMLPLHSPCDKTIQMVIRAGDGEYRRVSVCMSPSQWSLVEFAPRNGVGAVVAEQYAEKRFQFTAADKAQYEWLGELKSEFAQRIAHRFASGLSRVAVDNSEWLRRMEDLND